ncbi:MAG: CbiQ family ECF transporter T component, partial [Dehalococcoidia bacterium]|nr:CbiQ family ECF transporter T component [Dehalococcoidia bacterium]
LSYDQKNRNYGTLGGMLLIRSFDRAEKTYIAMVSRLYNPDSKVYVCRERVPLRDAAAGGTMVLLMGLLLLWEKGMF